MKTSRRNRIIPIIVVVAIVATIVVSFLSVFVIRDVVVSCYDQEGNAIAINDETNIGLQLTIKFSGSHIMTLDKQDVIDYVNTNYTSLHALAVVKQFPNQLAVHVVKREAVYVLSHNATEVYVDSFGYVVNEPSSSSNLFDITTSFYEPIDRCAIGSKLIFSSDKDNARLNMVINTVNSVWRLNYAYSDVAWLIDTIDFTVDNSSMTINTMQGAKIIIESPIANLEERLINAFSVYYDDSKDMQHSGCEINVSESGKITAN